MNTNLLQCIQLLSCCATIGSEMLFYPNKRRQASSTPPNDLPNLKRGILSPQFTFRPLQGAPLEAGGGASGRAPDIMTFGVVVESCIGRRDDRLNRYVLCTWYSVPVLQSVLDVETSVLLLYHDPAYSCTTYLYFSLLTVISPNHTRGTLAVYLARSTNTAVRCSR